MKKNYVENNYKKTPLMYQISEFDCGTTSIINAFKYLLNREEIIPEIYKLILEYTMDKNLGYEGTSIEGFENVCDKLNKICEENNIGIKLIKKIDFDFLKEISKLKEIINNNCCAILRVYQESEHYVLVTKITNKNFYIFDPYYLPINYYENDSEVKIIKTQPFLYNRKVSISRIIDTKSKKDFSVVTGKNKQIILIKKIKQNN